MPIRDTIPFHAVALADRPMAEAFCPRNPYLSCDYTFSNLIGWRHLYRTEVALHKGCLLVRFERDESRRHACLMPIGAEGEALREVLLDMEEDERALEGKGLTLMGVSPEALETLRALRPKQMTARADRDYSEYIYLREKLATLEGKKLQAKRNHCHRFERSYPGWRYEEIDATNTAECYAVEEEWYLETEPAEGMANERQMIRYALSHREEIGMTGGLLRVGGRVVAFTLGMPQSARCFNVNIEKASVAYDGAYAMINREYARRVPEQFMYINREEDMGLEGLRRAKLSYRPELILDEYTVELTL